MSGSEADERKSSKRKHKDRKDKKKHKHHKLDKHKKPSNHHSSSSGRKAGSPSNMGMLSSDETATEALQFKRAVQAHRNPQVVTSKDQSDLVYSSKESIASTLGLSKGLLRTSVSNDSVTQSYSKSLYGDFDDDANPAKRMRMMRERQAQRAIEIARETINAKRQQQTTDGDSGSSISLNGGLSLLNRFSSKGSVK